MMYTVYMQMFNADEYNNFIVDPSVSMSQRTHIQIHTINMDFTEIAPDNICRTFPSALFY